MERFKKLFLIAVLLLISMPMSGQGLSKGYRGFVDIGYTIGVGDFDNGRFEITTSHGYQFNSWLFIGGGMGINRWSGNLDATSTPLFGVIRFDVPFGGKLSPFVDFKIGGNLGDMRGFYFHPSLGGRFSLNEKCGLSLAVGYTLQKARVYWRDIEWTIENFGGISIKAGLDF